MVLDADALAKDALRLAPRLEVTTDERGVIVRFRNEAGLFENCGPFS